jgi:hypothetical protein
MSLALDDPSRDPDQLLCHLQQMAEVIARQNASLAWLRAERDSFLAERDLVREKHDAAQAEIEKLRLLIRNRRLRLAITHIFDQPQERLELRLRSMLGPDKITRSVGLSNGSVQKGTLLKEANKVLIRRGKMWVIASV